MRKNYDDALSGKSSMVAPIESNTLESLLDKQLAPCNFLLEKQSKSEDDRFLDINRNIEIWSKCIYEEEIYATKQVRLNNFHVFEWFPFSPGLFYTDNAKFHRNKAFHNIARMDDDLIVFNPHGKAHMVNGGVGNIRLKPRYIEERDSYFMTACSTPVCHEGFPILVPRDSYSLIIDEIKELGVATCTIEGEMRFLPSELKSLFQTYRDVPQLYLHVEKITKMQKTSLQVLDSLKVSVAVSFEGVFDKKEGVYWTYVNFNPANREEVRVRIDWLENRYVQRDYHGKIITDFDEQMKRFEDAEFSLEKIMNGQLTQKEANDFVNKYLQGQSNSQQYFKQYFYIEELNMTKYENINLQNSIFAAENAIVSGVINVRETGQSDVADAITKLSEILKQAPQEQLALEQKAEALDLLKAITENAGKSSPSKTILKALSTGLWEIIKNVEPITSVATPLWGTISKLWS